MQNPGWNLYPDDSDAVVEIPTGETFNGSAYALNAYFRGSISDAGTLNYGAGLNFNFEPNKTSYANAHIIKANINMSDVGSVTSNLCLFDAQGMTMSSSSSVDTLIGFCIGDVTLNDTAAITNYYGIRIGTLTAGSTNLGIYCETASKFTKPVEIENKDILKLAVAIRS